MRYIEERWDCDDYAIAAWAHARRHHGVTSHENLGIAIGVIAYVQSRNLEKHAANVIRLSTGELIVYDPQRYSTVPWPRDILFVWF
jgi:hypothetical protein